MDSLLVTAATNNTDCTTVSIPAQFKALSRWGAGPDSADAPIQWLQVLNVFLIIKRNVIFTQTYVSTDHDSMLTL